MRFRHINMALIIFLMSSCSIAFEDQKHVGQPSVCVCVHTRTRADTGVSDSVASSDKSPAGSTSLWEEGKPQQCGTGGRGRLERALGGGRSAGRFTSGNESEGSRTIVRMQNSVVFCAVNKGQVALGSLAERPSRVSTATGASDAAWL